MEPRPGIHHKKCTNICPISNQNPRILWRATSSIPKENPALNLIFYFLFSKLHTSKFGKIKNVESEAQAKRLHEYLTKDYQEALEINSMVARDVKRHTKRPSKKMEDLKSS